MMWPANSPDRSPIENLSDIIGRIVRSFLTTHTISNGVANFSTGGIATIWLYVGY